MSTSPLTDPAPVCLEHDASCGGLVELRPSLTGTGTPIARCDRHWHARLQAESAHRHRYPEHAPADFDPGYAGERWDEDAW